MAQATLSVRLDEETKQTFDPFYSEENMAHLRAAAARMDAGGGVEHDPIGAKMAFQCPD